MASGTRKGSPNFSEIEIQTMLKEVEKNTLFQMKMFRYRANRPLINLFLVVRPSFSEPMEFGRPRLPLSGGHGHNQQVKGLHG